MFQAIADPTRRDIIDLLSDKPLTVNALAENFDISRPAISKHLKILRECGLVKIEDRGRERICSARLENLKAVAEWTAQYRKFWNEKLNALGRFLDESDNQKTK